MSHSSPQYSKNNSRPHYKNQPLKTCLNHQHKLEHPAKAVSRQTTISKYELLSRHPARHPLIDIAKVRQMP